MAAIAVMVVVMALIMMYLDAKRVADLAPEYHVRRRCAEQRACGCGTVCHSTVRVHSIQ